ncbi:hypothetical protein PANN_61500 [Pseudomonas aeruginosa C-NN2]|nr:hypothetical protein PANN_61500 [Pseudomonas aeruginosa C-NN2]
MLLLPSPWGFPLPALCDCNLNRLRLAHMTLLRCARPGQHASQEQFHIE